MPSAAASRADLVRAATAAFARDVRVGLGRAHQKELPPTCFYDDVGSALFEVITLLPEYGLTRADERVLASFAGEIADRLDPPVVVAELGSGNGRKTRPILEALQARQSRVRYYPIDVSVSALARCAQELGVVRGARIVPLERSYLGGLREAAGRRRAGETLLALFLGSTIGNFDRGAAVEFLREVRGCLSPGDALLLGADLEKPEPQLLAAYDDPAGVTAAFNLNVLARINRELGADFDLGNFQHEACYNHRERRIEMHLRSRCLQKVSIPGAGITITIGEGETIWTESSHKYNLEELRAMAHRAGFGSEAHHVDQEWPFAECLYRAETRSA